jgi:hypothetical protein
MKIKRIDSIRNIRSAGVLIAAIATYYLFAETALSLCSGSRIGNDFEYFAAKTFSPIEWKTAENFMNDLLSIGQRGVLKKGTIVYNYKPASTKTVNFNSTGFRGEEITKKQKDEVRIAIFGCSRIWGNFEPDNETIPAIVGRELNEKFSHRKISVINMGIEGYDIQRASEAAKMYHEEVQFDIAVFYFGYIDMTFAYLNGIRNWEPFEEDTAMDEKTFKQLTGMSGDENIIERTGIYKTVKQSVRGEILDKTAQDSVERESIFRDIPEIQNKTAEMFPAFFTDRMLKTSEYFRKINIPVFFVLPPTAQTKEPLSELEKKIAANYELLFPGYNRYIMKCTDGVVKQLRDAADGLNFIDHSDIFEGEPDTVFYDGMHMTPSGSRKSAREIAGFLSGFLEKNLPEMEKNNLK